MRSAAIALGMLGAGVTSAIEVMVAEIPGRAGENQTTLFAVAEEAVTTSSAANEACFDSSTPGGTQSAVMRVVAPILGVLRRHQPHLAEIVHNGEGNDN
jgi:hypothetical protein